MALMGADAAKAALSKLNAECALPLGYAPPDLRSFAPSESSNTKQDSAQHVAGMLDTSGGHAGSAGRSKTEMAQDDGSAVESLQRLVADVSRHLVESVVCMHTTSHSGMTDAAICCRLCALSAHLGTYSELTLPP